MQKRSFKALIVEIRAITSAKNLVLSVHSFATAHKRLQSASWETGQPSFSCKCLSHIFPYETVASVDRDENNNFLTPTTTTMFSVQIQRILDQRHPSPRKAKPVIEYFCLLYLCGYKNANLTPVQQLFSKNATTFYDLCFFYFLQFSSRL